MSGSLGAIQKNFSLRILTATNKNSTDKSIFIVAIPPDLAGKINAMICAVTGAWGSLGVINSYLNGNNINIKTNISAGEYNTSFLILFLLK